MKPEKKFLYIIKMNILMLNMCSYNFVLKVFSMNIVDGRKISSNAVKLDLNSLAHLTVVSGKV